MLPTRKPTNILLIHIKSNKLEYINRIQQSNRSVL